MRLFVLCFLLSATLGVGIAQAAQPRTISYQGSLQDGGGLVSPDGNYTMSFRLWDAASGGLLLWQETDTVAVAGGLFNVALGKNSPFTQTFTNPYWLGITVGTNPELTPRVKFQASPYAMHSIAADSLSGGLPGDFSCHVYQTGGSIPNNSQTAVNFTTEVWDNGGFHDNLVNPSRLTAPKSGSYLVTVFADWAVPLGSGNHYINIRTNGTTYWGSVNSNASGDIMQNLSMIIRMNAGDYVELVLAHDTGATRTLDTARLAAAYLGK